MNPHQDSVLVGRDDLLAALADESARLVSLVGPGGAGKSRLASAHAAATGAVLVSLEGRWTTDELVRGVADALGLTSVDDLRGLGAALGRRGPTRLVLDDLDRAVEPAAALIEVLLAAAPEARIVATCRDVLGALGEVVRRVGGLDPDAAFALFRAASESPCDPRYADPSAVAPLLGALDRLPLAIELAAAWTDRLPLDALARHLDPQQLDLLAGRRRPRDPRDVVAACWALLTAEEQAVLQGVALFAASFSLADAEAALDRTDLAQVVERLERRALVRPGFRLCDPVRSWVIAEVGLDPASLSRHRARLARLGAPEALARFHGPARRQALAECAPARRDLAEELGRAVADEDPLAVPIARALAKLPGAPAERLATLERVRGIQSADHRYELDRAVLLRVFARTVEARAATEAALAAARRAEDVRAEIEALDLLGVLDGDRGEGNEARARFAAAIELAERIGDPVLQARVLVDRAWLDVIEARTEKAERGYRQALERLPPDHGDARAAALSDLASVYRETGRDPIPLYEQALVLHRTAEDEVGAAIVLGSIAAAHAERGSLTVARDGFEAALARVREVGHRHAEARFLASRSFLARVEGRYDEAEADLAAALPVMEELGDRRVQALVRGELGEMAVERGRPAEAVRLLNTAIALASASRSGRLCGVFHGTLAVALARTGDADGARAALAEARALLADGGFVEEQVRLLARQALVERALGDEEAARASALAARAEAPAHPARWLAAALEEADRARAPDASVSR